MKAWDESAVIQPTGLIPLYWSAAPLLLWPSRIPIGNQNGRQTRVFHCSAAAVAVGSRRFHNGAIKVSFDPR